MKHAFVFCLIILLMPHRSSAQREADVVALYEALSHPTLDENGAATIDDILLIRGAQEILLKKGTLRLMAPASNRTFGAVFIGQGTYTLIPPTSLEREEFERQTSYKLLNGKYDFTFDRAVFWFHDTLLRELGSGIHYGKKEIERSEKEAVERSLKYATDKSNENVLYHLSTELLEPDPKPYLFAHFFLPEKKEIFLTYDVRRFEEVAIHKPPYEAITGSVYWLQLLNSFHLLEEYSTASEYELVREEKRRYEFISNTITLSIENGGRTSGRATLHARAMRPNQSTMNFILDPTLTIDSITTTTGQRINFHRNEHAWEGILALPQQDSLDYHLSFSYNGDFLKPFNKAGYSLRVGNRFVQTSGIAGSFYELSSASGWYPTQPGIDHMTFDVTYRVPNDMKLVGAGKKLTDAIVGDYSISRYQIHTPSLNNSFSLGFFKEERFQADSSLPIITLYDIGGGEPEKVVKDIANSVKLFSFLFGKPDMDELRATPGPLIHGEAHPGLIQLPWFEEYVGNDKKKTIIGRPHEVAHMWWGVGVGSKSYHDWWLAEAFSQYSALLYARFVLNKDDAMFEKLKEWREKITGARKFALGSGPKLGSVWLGYRASSSQTPNDYSLSTYLKGALAVHMLRMMLLDLSTFEEHSFKSLMAEFYQTYRGKEATTYDFMKMTEKYTGIDMRWFFDQWIYGTEIPTLKCGKTVTKTPEGKYTLKLTVEQKDVTKPFVLYPLVEIKYPAGRSGRVRLAIDQMQNEFTYVLDQEPETVTFNVMESLLCNIEE